MTVKLHSSKQCHLVRLKQLNVSLRSARLLTLNLLTTTIVAPPNNASKWQMGFNSAFKGLKLSMLFCCMGHAVAQLVETLRCKSEGRGFDSRCCHWN